MELGVHWTTDLIASVVFMTNWLTATAISPGGRLRRPKSPSLTRPVALSSGHVEMGSCKTGWLGPDAGCTIVAVSGIVFAVAVLATSIALVAGLAWASRRLLGLPVGALRALIAGLLGFVAALLVGRALRATQSGHLAAFFTVALGVPLIVAMIFIVVAEALVPSGTWPGPVEVINGARSWFARSRRYSQISRIAVRHGLGPYLRGRPRRDGDPAGGRAALALSLRHALEEGGVTFIKLGQLLSTRRDLLPEEFASELAQLQDRTITPSTCSQGTGSARS